MPRILGKQSSEGSGGNLTTSLANSYTMPEDGVLNSLTYYVAYDNSPTNRPGDEDIRAAVYIGGTSDTNPNGAVLLEDLGVFELDGTYGGSFITFNTSGRYEIAAGTRVWIAVKSDATYGIGYRFETGVTGDSVSGFVSDSDDEVAWESTISSAGTQGTTNITMYITYTARGETKTTKPPTPEVKLFPKFVSSASLDTEVYNTEKTMSIDIGSGENRKLMVFLGHQDVSSTDYYTLTYDPNGINYSFDIFTSVEANKPTDSNYELGLYYYDIPDGETGTKDITFTNPNRCRIHAHVYEDCAPGVPTQYSLESYPGPYPVTNDNITSSIYVSEPSMVLSATIFETNAAGQGIITASHSENTRLNGPVTTAGAQAFSLSSGDYTVISGPVTSSYTSSAESAGASAPGAAACALVLLQNRKEASDFKIQRGVVDITAISSSVLLAGVDYEPINSSSAFVRMTSNRSIGSGGEANFTTARHQFKISDINNLETSLQFESTGTAKDATIDWEIIEYSGPVGGDNEFIVRHVEDLTFSDGDVTQQSSSVVTNIENDNDVVVFLGGAIQLDPASPGTAEPCTLAVTSWDSSSQRAFVDKYQEQFTVNRSAELQIMVVEFTGKNWKVQRIPEHTFSSRNEESISIPVAISSTSSAFIHPQYRYDSKDGTGSDQNKNLIAKVYLKDVNTIEAKVTGSEAGTQGSGSVAVWLIENTQKHGQKMNVTHYSEFRDKELSTNPDIFSSSLQSTVNIDTTSIMGESAARKIENMDGSGYYNSLLFSVGISSSGQEVVITRGTDINAIDYTFSTVEWPTEYRSRGLSIQSDTQWFYDDFNRPNQSITASGDWDENTLYISDNGVNWFIEDGALGGQDFAALNGFAFLNTASYQWTNDHLSEVVYADIGSFDFAGPAVRLNFGPGHESGSGYVLFHDGVVDGGRRIRRMDNGSLAGGGSSGNFSIAAGDKVRLQAVGTTISCYVNGNLAVSWTESTYESGSVGVFYKKEDVTQTKFDSFYAQNIVSGQTGKPFKIS